MPELVTILGQDRTASTGQVLMWIAVLIVAAIGGGLAVMLIRRRLLSKDTGPSNEGFMDELRRARDSGAMSPEEYDRIRKTMAARLAGKPPPPSRPPQTPPATQA